MYKRKKPKMVNNPLETNSKIKEQLNSIDGEVSKFIYEIINDTTNEEGLYLKTEFAFMSYNIYLFYNKTNCIVGKSWPIIEFLQLGSEKKLEYELNVNIKKMLLEVTDKNNENEAFDMKNIKWI